MARLSCFHFMTIVLISLAVLCFSASAEPPATATESGFDLKTSRVYILVDKKGLGHQHGVEGRLKSGGLALGSSSDAGEIVFEMTSFKADTDDARKHVGLKDQTDANTQEKVTENMLGPKVLDVENYPTATFKIDSAIATGKRSESDHPLYELNGAFTLHGTKRPLTVIAESVASKGATRIRGQFKILQTDFDMKPYTMALGAVGVADELKIWSEIDLKPSSETPGKKP